MRAVRKQFTLGSLMIAIAAVAGLLAVPRETWDSIVFWVVNCAALMILGLVGFGLGHLGSKLATGVGEAIVDSFPEGRPRPLEAERTQCPPT